MDSQVERKEVEEKEIRIFESCFDPKDMRRLRDIVFAFIAGVAVTLLVVYYRGGIGVW